ncbi:MAG: histone deacetylase family protein [Elusimicrobia bacterium]|nr:histone deacetylase family protein [Elusimicrobiota bacterium]
MVKIISSPKSWEYNAPGHPESPQRVKDSYNYLKSKGYEITEAVSCSDEDVLRVHTKQLLREVKSEDFVDADTPALPGIYKYALLSAGAAIQASESAINGQTAFSLMRPPGHHAESGTLGGFCYFNNIAIAIKYLFSKKLVKKVAILDVDCHHGNGTEEIFYGDKNVLFTSIHQSPLYPGTGLTSKENCKNFPIAPGTDEGEYLKTLGTVLSEIKKFGPDIITISAGFDTYIKDPITNIKLTKDSYKKIGTAAKSLGIARFAVLEGGYSPDLPECIRNFIEGME